MVPSARFLYLITLRLEQNGRHFAEDIFKCNLKIYWKLPYLDYYFTETCSCLSYRQWVSIGSGSQQTPSHFYIYWRINASFGISCTRLHLGTVAIKYLIFEHIVLIDILRTWWRYQMETFSGLLALCEGNLSVTDGFPSQRPVTQSFDVFFDLRPNKRLSKQLRRRWFETPSRSLCRHCDVSCETALKYVHRDLNDGASTLTMAKSRQYPYELYMYMYACFAYTMNCQFVQGNNQELRTQTSMKFELFRKSTP